MLMPDSRLNGPERDLQHSFMKSSVFNGLIMVIAISLIALLIRAMPDRRAKPSSEFPLTYRPVELVPVEGPLHLAGAWELEASDRRFGGLSALASDNGKFLAVSDRGTVVAFDRPGFARPMVRLSDLRQGPGPSGKKWARDAESIVGDPEGRGWWVGFEQRHSIWLYDRQLRHALASIALPNLNWSDNGGAEGLAVFDGRLVVFGENGRDAISINRTGPQQQKVNARAEIADAAKAPDGSIWVLLRQPGISGIAQSIAPLRQDRDGWTIGPVWALPKGLIDNFEGMLIEQQGDGGWRFWLISDNDFRSVARTLLVALEVNVPARHDQSPATGAGPSKKPSDEKSKDAA
jgi:hypothetical protein